MAFSTDEIKRLKKSGTLEEIAKLEAAARAKTEAAEAAAGGKAPQTKDTGMGDMDILRSLRRFIEGGRKEQTGNFRIWDPPRRPTPAPERPPQRPSSPPSLPGRGRGRGGWLDRARPGSPAAYGPTSLGKLTKEGMAGEEGPEGEVGAEEDYDMETTDTGADMPQQTTGALGKLATASKAFNPTQMQAREDMGLGGPGGAAGQFFRAGAASPYSKGGPMGDPGAAGAEGLAGGMTGDYMGSSDRGRGQPSSGPPLSERMVGGSFPHLDSLAAGMMGDPGLAGAEGLAGGPGAGMMGDPGAAGAMGAGGSTMGRQNLLGNIGPNSMQFGGGGSPADPDPGGSPFGPGGALGGAGAGMMGDLGAAGAEGLATGMMGPPGVAGNEGPLGRGNLPAAGPWSERPNPPGFVEPRAGDVITHPPAMPYNPTDPYTPMPKLGGADWPRPWSIMNPWGTELHPQDMADLASPIGGLIGVGEHSGMRVPQQHPGMPPEEFRAWDQQRLEAEDALRPDLPPTPPGMPPTTPPVGTPGPMGAGGAPGDIMGPSASLGSNPALNTLAVGSGAMPARPKPLRAGMWPGMV